MRDQPKENLVRKFFAPLLMLLLTSAFGLGIAGQNSNSNTASNNSNVSANTNSKTKSTNKNKNTNQSTNSNRSTNTNRSANSNKNTNANQSSNANRNTNANRGTNTNRSTNSNTSAGSRSNTNAGSSTGGQHGLIDINAASKQTLVGLPEIGEVYAQKIIDGRPYKRKDELVRRGIITQDMYKRISSKIVAHQPKP